MRTTALTNRQIVERYTAGGMSLYDIRLVTGLTEGKIRSILVAEKVAIRGRGGVKGGNVGSSGKFVRHGATQAAQA